MQPLHRCVLINLVGNLISQSSQEGFPLASAWTAAIKYCNPFGTWYELCVLLGKWKTRLLTHSNIEKPSGGMTFLSLCLREDAAPMHRCGLFIDRLFVAY